MDIINALLATGVDPNAQLNMRRPSNQGGRFSDPLLSSGTTPLLRAVVNNDMRADDSRPCWIAPSVGNQLCNRMACVSDHDLLALSNTPEQVGEKVPCFVCVVLRKPVALGALVLTS